MTPTDPSPDFSSERDASPWRELAELLWQERAYALFPLVFGCGLGGLGLVAAQLAGPLAPFIYPFW